MPGVGVGDQRVAARWGELQAYAQLRGRPRPTNDSWVAACCLVREPPPATFNTKGFADFGEHEACRCRPPSRPACASPTGWMMSRMMSTGRGGGVQDDLGARLLAAHPRGEQWRQLDVTVANLTFDQLDRMGELAADAGRDVARAELIDGIADGELLGRLGSRWVRWASTFGLPQPVVHLPPPEILRHPYALADTSEVPAAYLAGVLAVFDAGLAIAAAPTDAAGTATYELLSGPWRRACLPSRFTPATAYGPHTQPALAVLRQARSLPPEAVIEIRQGRAAVDRAEWTAARHEVDDSATAWGYPLRPQCLFWEAVPAAEDAAGESPTDPYLADALWAAAATQAFAGRLSDATGSVLASPWRAAGLTLPT